MFISNIRVGVLLVSRLDIKVNNTKVLVLSLGMVEVFVGDSPSRLSYMNGMRVRESRARSLFCTSLGLVASQNLPPRVFDCVPEGRNNN